MDIVTPVVEDTFAFLLLVFASVVRDDLAFLFPFMGVVGSIEVAASLNAIVGTAALGSVVTVAGVEGPSRRGVSEGVIPGDAGEFKFNLPRLWVDQRPCIDLLRTFEP